MIQLIIFTLVSILSLSSKIAIVSTLESEKITGAYEAPSGYFKYHVSIQSDTYPGRNRCGGGIIGDRHIITAAHCVVGHNRQFNQQRLIVVAGTENLYSTAGSVRVPVKRAFVLSAFQGILTGNDVAVLELSQPLGIGQSSSLYQLSLPSTSVSYTGQTAIVTGFGLYSIKLKFDKVAKKYVEYNGKYDGKLRYAETIVQTQNSCKDQFMNRMDILPSMVCSKIVSSKAKRRDAGICSGDSGSPLVYNGVVIGTVSSSIAGCNEDVFPGVYTRISSFLPFVNNAMRGAVDSTMRVHNFV